MDRIRIRKPDDFHLHLRQGENLGEYARQSAAGFARALIMPNTLPPVCDAPTLRSYREAILRETRGFEPLMTFKILPGMSPGQIRSLKEAGALAGKLYPAGSTTNAEDGVSSLDQIRDTLALMEEEGLILSIHGEDPRAPVLDRERRFLPQLEEIVAGSSRLKIVLEHLSCRESLRCLRDLPARVAGTVTVHHLLFSLDDLMGGALDPHLFCKPVIKTEEDRKALAEAVLSGWDRLFFGSDSAPHLLANKEAPRAAAGIFSAPAALPLLADFFDREGCLDRLESFVSLRGARFYGLAPNEERIVLRRESFSLPPLIGGARPLAAGKELAWRVFPDGEIPVK